LKGVDTQEKHAKVVGSIYTKTYHHKMQLLRLPEETLVLMLLAPSGILNKFSDRSIRQVIGVVFRLGRDEFPVDCMHESGTTDIATLLRTWT
jgi:hypothetical protein